MLFFTEAILLCAVQNQGITLTRFTLRNQEEKVKIYQWPLGVGLENLHFKHGDATEIIIDFVSTQTSSQSSDIKIHLFK